MENSKINKKRLRKDFSKAASSYNEAAIVQHTICDRTLERVELLNINPKLILDIGSGTGRSIIELQKIYPKSYIIANDIAIPMLEVSRQSISHKKNSGFVCDDMQLLPFKDEAVDLIFSTSTFQWCNDINQLFSECYRVLCDEGILIFSTFGPDTLKELRESWRQVDDLEHVHKFIDMHNIGDVLLANQFHDPVVDMEMFTIKYQKLNQLLKDLKNTGSRSKFHSSFSNSNIGLLSKNRYSRLEQAYEQFRSSDETLPASYEVIYGYAKKSLRNHSISDVNEVWVPMDEIQRNKQ